ncbi:MAG: hypothetical protein HY319_05220 [Armatimonadetes bacterium]|nr:hypothetical protein [Armatimonadota bacterium]
MSESMSWGDFALSLYDKLTGRGAEITYQFDNLEIYVPLSVGGGTDHGHWRLNGTLKIRTKDGAEG